MKVPAVSRTFDIYLHQLLRIDVPPLHELMELSVSFEVFLCDLLTVLSLEDLPCKPVIFAKYGVPFAFRECHLCRSRHWLGIVGVSMGARGLCGVFEVAGIESFGQLLEAPIGRLKPGGEHSM